ncbi:MAG TPA: hypothetical protein VGB56_14640 [Flavisolibacter sp.]
MSTRNDIIDGTKAGSRSGLVYTCHGGWIDLGHARADNAKDNLWEPLLRESGSRSKDGKGFRMRFSESHSRYGFTESFAKEYYIRYGLPKSEKESIALSIFMEVSYGFESMQNRFYYSPFTDSGFSAEDLVSDLIGFYRAVRPGPDYVTPLRPVSKAAAQKIWDEHGAVGKQKNFSFDPFLYPCSECSNSPSRPISGQLPELLTSIKPATRGASFREWSIIKDYWGF